MGAKQLLQRQLYDRRTLSNPRERASKALYVQRQPQSSLVPLTASVPHQVMTILRRIHHRQHPLVHTWRSLSSNFHHPCHGYQLCLVIGIQLAVDSLQIVLVRSSQLEIVCRIRDVFFQRGELCNVVQCCNFHNCYVCVCIFAMLSSIHPH